METPPMSPASSTKSLDQSVEHQTPSVRSLDQSVEHQTPSARSLDPNNKQMVLSLVRTYLLLAVKNYSPTRTVNAKKLLEMIIRSDPSAIDFLKEHRDDEVLTPYTTDEIISCLSSEFGLILNTDDDCIKALRYFESHTKHADVMHAMTKCLTFIQLPENTLLSEETFPFEDLRDVLVTWMKEFPKHQGLIQGTVQYLKDAINLSQVPTATASS